MTTAEEQCIIQVNYREISIANTPTKLAKKWATKVNNLKQTHSAESERWKKQSVYRIPFSVTNLCRKAYTPHTVSIGPYHHGKKQLKAMEEHKRRALLHFLSRSQKPIEFYFNALEQVMDDLRDAYDQLDDKWKRDNNEAFLEVMIVDGCFILELLRTTTAKPAELKQMGYAENDPVFSNHGKLYIVPYLKRDMLMLENQLPLQVLTTLLCPESDTLTINDISKKEQEIIELILKFFSQPHKMSNMEQLGKCSHILDVNRKSLLLGGPRRKTKADNRIQDDQYIRSATELEEAGIRFKKSETRSLSDISFHRGVLELPLIVVDDALESQLLNIMALERFHFGAGNAVTSYVFFMDSIIDSARDVKLLHSCGIIQNGLGSDKAVAKLFNTISKDITLDPDSSLGMVHKQVSKYCSRPWHKWKAYLKHNYFTNPWTLISLLAAIFLFALTGLQTVYGGLGYYQQNN